jgi:hypothetical protein
LRQFASPMSLPSFLRTVLHPGSPFPPRGPSGRFPRFVGTTRGSDASPPFPPRFVAFARSVPSRALPRAPPSGGDGASQVPGEPLPACPALRPRWVRHAEPFAAHGVPACRCGFPLFRRRRHPRRPLFGAQSHGLHARCLRFAARGLPSAPRKTRFRLGASLGREGPPDPHGFHREVSVLLRFILYMTSSSPRLGLAHRERRRGRTRTRTRTLTRTRTR